MPAVSWRALAVLIALGLGSAVRAETIAVGVDEARIMRLPQGAATVVIGNPLIADASLQSGGVLVLTGKGYGSTNLIALDRGGRMILELTVRVETSKSGDLVVVYRGDRRESYSCAPDCVPRITLGDDLPYFAAAQAQSKARLGEGGGGGPSR